MVHRGPARGPSRSWCRSPAPRARRAWPGVLRSSWLRAATRRGSPARSDPAGDRTARGCRRRTAHTCSASSRHLGTHRLSSGARRRRARSTEAFPCSPLGSARSTGPSACCGRSRPRAGRTIVRPRSMGIRPIERWTARCRRSTPALGTSKPRSGRGGLGSARSWGHARTPHTRRSCRTDDVRRTGSRCRTGRSTIVSRVRSPRLSRMWAIPSSSERTACDIFA